MAIKATIFKADLAVADMDRNHFEDYALRLARHPSETDERMMLRLLAFMMFADSALAFGKGLSSDEEPDLWIKDLTGAIDLWVLIGQLDERWLRKAAGRSKRVAVFTFGGRVAEMWWEQNRSTLSKLSNLSVFSITPESSQALAALVSRNMSLQCMIQDGELLITNENGSVRIEPTRIFG